MAYVRLYGLFNLCLYRVQIEARPLLHRRERDEGLTQLGDLLLHEYATPEFVLVPIDEAHRLAHAGALVGVEPEVGDERPIDLLGGAEPARRLIGEAILDIIDSRR